MVSEDKRLQRPERPPFSSLPDAVSYLDRFQFHGFRLGLDRIEAVLQATGNPQSRYPCIHVAGTNGKGSVCAALVSIFTGAGCSVGLYTSPHLYKLNERFRLGLEPVIDSELLQLINEIGMLVESGMELSYFEFTTAMAFLWFARRKVDIAIVETGLGGRLDATNVITPLVSVITNISLEHQAYLGNTIGKIAGEKAGIIKPGRPVVSGLLHPEAMPVIEKTAAARQARLARFGREFHAVHGDRGLFDYSGMAINIEGLRFGLAGSHQAENAAIAIAATEVAAAQGLFSLGQDTIKAGLRNTYWPGRSELLVNGTRKVLLDGAHNMAGVDALRKLLEESRDQGCLPASMDLLWACSDEGGDKDINALLDGIAPLFRRIVITEPRGPRKPVPLEAWKQAAGKWHADLEPDWEAAVQDMTGRLSMDSLLVIAGSLYLVGPARHKLMSSGFGTQPFIC